MFSRTMGGTLAVGAAILVLSLAAGCSGGQSRLAVHMEKGRKYLAANSYEKARIEFQNALQINPKDAEAHYETGIVDEKLGHLPEAARSYQEAIDLTPKRDHLDATIALAKLFVLNGAADRALDVIQAALQQHADAPELLALRAVCRERKQDLTGAEADALHAMQLAPKNEDAIAALAGIYKSQGQGIKAQMLVEHAVQNIPGSTALHFMLAQIYTDAGRPVDAAAQYQKLIELNRSESSHRIRLAQFYTNTGQLDAAEATLRRALKDLPAERSLKLSLIDFLSARRSPATAAEELKKMVAAEPQDSDLQLALARMYRASGEIPKAEALYRGVIDKEHTRPPGLEARNRLAVLRFQQSDSDGALALVNAVLAQDPGNNDALLIRGNIELVRNDPRSAIVDLRTVLRDQPSNAEVLRTLVRAHLANREPQLAKALMEQAVDANPRDAALQKDLAELLVRIGAGDESNRVIAKAVEQLPGNIEVLDTQFRIAMTTKDLVRAKTAADAMLSLQPELPLGHMYEGVVAEAQKRYDEALREYTIAGNSRPDASEPLEAVVRVLSETKRLPEALKRLDDAAAKYPTNPMPLDAKGQYLMQNGRLAEAKEAFTQATVRAPKWWPAYRDMAKAQLLGKEDVAAVIDGLRRAKALVDQSEQLSEALANLLVRAGKPQEAIAENEEALHKYPKSDATANNLAMLLVTYRTDPPSLARARGLAARFADSQSPAYLDTYGWVLYKGGEAAAAVPVFARLVAAQPNAVVARYHLGMAQALAGNRAEARNNLLRVIDSGQRFPGLDEAKSALDRLNKEATDVAPRT